MNGEASKGKGRLFLFNTFVTLKPRNIQEIINECSVDPGWNDPPMLTFDAAHPPPKSRIANKRIPFPLGPTSQPKPVIVSPDNKPTIDDVEESVPNMKDLTFRNFQILLGPQPVEVQDKISLMKAMWTKGELNTSLKNDLYKLSDYMSRKDYVAANKLNLELHMKYPDECKNWISAISCLIQDK